MCIYVHLHPTVSVEGLAVWFPDRPGIEEIKWNQKEIRITAASFSTHTCTALLSPDGNTHLHTFFDLLSLNLDVWFSFRLWGFFSFWQSFSFRQTDGAWSHERAVQMFGGSVGQTRGCGWQAWLIDTPIRIWGTNGFLPQKRKTSKYKYKLEAVEMKPGSEMQTINQSRMLT